MIHVCRLGLDSQPGFNCNYTIEEMGHIINCEVCVIHQILIVQRLSLRVRVTMLKFSHATSIYLSEINVKCLI